VENKQIFFQEQREQSVIKTRIVSKYFLRWAHVILATQAKHPEHSQKMAYIDFFAGPGKYDDQSKSTPLLVLEAIIANPKLAERVITIFNDKDNENIKSLKNEVRQLDGIERLTNKPAFHSQEIGEAIAEFLSTHKLAPTFFFVDPWGYKGVSLRLISSFIKDWGSDGVFFFNYNRVNMGIDNEAVKLHMHSLFGETRFNFIRSEFEKTQNPWEREVIILQELCGALRQNGCRFVLPFRFKNNKGNRTSHHLIFVSKNFLGYDIMKEIMYEESSEKKNDVASFEYNPQDLAQNKLGSLFDMLSRPLEDLEKMLSQQYEGKTIHFKQLYHEHSIDKPYIKKNYKYVLRKMYEKGRIFAVNAKTGKKPLRGFSDDLRITFGGRDDKF
jgi:three-Cys-motif partner protein